MSGDAMIAAHAIEVVHAVTGQGLRPLAAALVAPAWPGWRLLTRGHVVVLAARASDIARAPAATRVAISAPQDAAVLADAGATTIELGRPLHLDQAVAARTRQLGLEPADAVLELHLVDEHGLPLSGRRVAAVALGADAPSAPPDPGAASVPLAETAPGTYRSAGRRWDRVFRPFAITLDGRTVARREMDYHVLLTRLRLVVCHQPTTASGV
jgi:hypothetical protein